jgi:hypothetical protein
MKRLAWLALVLLALARAAGQVQDKFPAVDDINQYTSAVATSVEQ